MAASLQPGQLRELRQVFEAFDGDADGLLQASELGAVLQACGIVMSEPECLDLVTEVQPNLRQLPFEEFVAIMCSQLPGGRTFEQEVVQSFTFFSGQTESITPSSLSAAHDSLGQPISKLMASAPQSNAPSPTPLPLLL